MHTFFHGVLPPFFPAGSSGTGGMMCRQVFKPAAGEGLRLSPDIAPERFGVLRLVSSGPLTGKHLSGYVKAFYICAIFPENGTRFWRSKRIGTRILL
jgi:hypothetical protein